MEDIFNSICNIKVIGVGGGGNNTVNRMISAGVSGVHFVAINTDKQDLLMSNADQVIQIGKELTKGLGAGSNSNIGKAAAEESAEEIKKMLYGTDLVFITAGLGGGTGNGAAPVVAKYAKDMGILTVGVVTKPFRFEGYKRATNAEEGLKELRKNVDSLMVIPNDKLYTIFKKDITFVDAFRYADDVLRQAIQGVSDVILKPANINLDFADVAAIMRNKGTAHMGIGTGKGANKTIEAVRQAVTSQLLETSIEGAESILMHISGGKDLTLTEVYEAADLVRDVIDEKCNFIFGFSSNDNEMGETTVTIIATGFEKKPENVEEQETTQPTETKATAEQTENAETQPVDKQEESQPQSEKEEQKEAEEVKEEPTEPVEEEKVEDISIKTQSPVLDDEDIPPFLRKLRK